MPITVYGKANGEGLDMLYHLEEGQVRPFANHCDTMHMDAVRPKDLPRGRKMYYKEDAQALRTHDLPFARPTYHYKDFYVDGPPQKEPVPGSAAKTLYPEINRSVDHSLAAFDIPGAQPNVEHLKTGRSVNPLNPKYDLPSWMPEPAGPPQMRVHEGEVRDTLAVKGEWTPRILERNYSRNPAQPRPPSGGPIQRRPRQTRDNMKVVEKAGERILSSKNNTPRMSDPQDPVYRVPASTTHPFHKGEAHGAYAPHEAGPVHGATPRILHKDNGEPQASLVRRDIPGALPQRYKGGLPFNIYDAPEVTPFAQHLGLECADIEGTQTGTRKPGTL